MSKLPALLLRGVERAESTGHRVPVVPRPRAAADEVRPRPVIRRGAEALQLLDVAAPPRSGLHSGSLLVGFAVGAVVAGRRRSR